MTQPLFILSLLKLARTGDPLTPQLPPSTLALLPSIWLYVVVQVGNIVGYPNIGLTLFVFFAK